MKKQFIPLLVLMFFMCTLAVKAQVVVIDNFESSVKDSLYLNNIEGGSTMVQTDNTADKHQGNAALNFKATVANLHSWGSYAQLIRTRKPGQPFMNWQGSDSLSLWLKVVKAPKDPAHVVFRIHIGDRIDTTGDLEEYVYENATILDTAAGWVNLKVPLREVDSKDATVNPGDQGFVIVPSSWNPPTRNDRKLDLTHISQYNISFITTMGAADSIEVLYDNFTRTGSVPLPFIVFNGKALNSEMTNGVWGGSTLEVVPNAGSQAGKSAMVWTTGGSWTGTYWDFAEKNMGGNWIKNDTLKFKIKAAKGTAPIRVQFLAGGSTVAGKTESSIKYVIRDADGKFTGNWEQVAIPIGKYVISDGKDGWDSTKVKKFELIGEDGIAVAGTKIYFDDFWMGSPSFDVIAPVAVKNLVAQKNSFVNGIAWDDVPGEAGAKYDVYYSSKPITSLTQSDIEVVALGVAAGAKKADHVLRAPVTDQDLSYYYAITCTDASGNVSPIASVGPVVNKAKGIPTISLTVPSNFAVDGKLTEWTAAGIKPISIKLSDGTGSLPANQTITNDADLSTLAYIAIDKTNLYVAFDITDDAVYAGQEINKDSWLRDSPDLFLGLYNFHGAYHKSLARVATPDYHFRFNKERLFLDGLCDSLVNVATNYKFSEKLTGGYIVEAKIPLVDLATKRNSGYSGLLDNVFVPADGMRIPIDFSINDNDNGTTREGILTYSKLNEDQSWGDVSRWTYTWIGTKMYVTGVEKINEGPVSNYALSQNYPNPFNPSTTIKYSIANPGKVTLKVYDVIGKEITTLVNQDQEAGSYQVRFDASNLSSGIYFYRIESGSFSQVSKMMLIK